MSYEATYNPSDPTVPNIVTAWNSVDAPTHNPNTINNPNISALGTDNQSISPVGISKVSGGALVLLTAQELSNIAAAQATALNLSERASAQAIIQSPSDEGKVLRGEADQLIIQLNLHSTFEAALLAAIAAASSLANLQTRCAALTPPSQVTLAQAKTAIVNDVASGNVD